MLVQISQKVVIKMIQLNHEMVLFRNYVFDFIQDGPHQ